MKIRRGRATVTGENLPNPPRKPLAHRRAGKAGRFVGSQKPGDLPSDDDEIRFAAGCMGIAKISLTSKVRRFLFYGLGEPGKFPTQSGHFPVRRRGRWTPSTGDDWMVSNPALQDLLPSWPAGAFHCARETIQSNLSIPGAFPARTVEPWQWHNAAQHCIMGRNRVLDGG